MPRQSNTSNHLSSQSLGCRETVSVQGQSLLQLQWQVSHCATQRCPWPSRTKNRGQGTLSCCFYILWLLKAQEHRVLSQVKGRRKEIKRGQRLPWRLVWGQWQLLFCFVFPLSTVLPDLGRAQQAWDGPKYRNGHSAEPAGILEVSLTMQWGWSAQSDRKMGLRGEL